MEKNSVWIPGVRHDLSLVPFEESLSSWPPSDAWVGRCGGMMSACQCGMPVLAAGAPNALCCVDSVRRLCLSPQAASCTWFVPLHRSCHCCGTQGRYSRVRSRAYCCSVCRGFRLAGWLAGISFLPQLALLRLAPLELCSAGGFSQPNPLLLIRFQIACSPYSLTPLLLSKR